MTSRGLALISLVTLFVFALFGPYSLEGNTQNTVLTTRLQQDKAAVQSQIDSLNSTLRQKGSELLDITARKNTLQAEIAAKENSIAELDTAITEARVAEAQINEQIRINEERQAELYSQMEILIPQIQKESRKTRIQTIIEAENIAQFLRRLNGLSTVQSELNSLNERIEKVNLDLEDNRRQLQEVQEALENTKALQQSERDSLTLLLEQTQGEESQYQQLISDLQSQRREQQAQVEQLDAEYQAEIERIRAEEERQRIIAEQSNANSNDSNGGNSGGNSGGTSGGNSGGSSNQGSIPAIPTGNCRFEDGRTLSVRLSRPAAGYISDTFGCPSVTGRWHDGYDIANGLGTPIYAAFGGVVERKGFQAGGFGHYIFLRHSANGQTFYTLYAHMRSESFVPVGAVVGGGAQIGEMGSTGWSTGPHLHFMIYSDSYSITGDLGCTYGTTKCFNPGRYTNF